jgi:hypothetical protein
VQPTLEDGLRALRESAELAKNIRIELTDEYLRLVALVEAMPQNQSGARKSSCWLGDRRLKDFSKSGYFVARKS